MVKSDVLEHKSGNISETRKDREEFLWRAYRKSPTLFRKVPSLTLYGFLFPKIGGSQPPPKNSIAIISGTDKATEFKFGRYIHRVHPNNSPLKIIGEKGAWAYPGTAQIFWVPTIISGTGKVTNFKFCMHIFNLNRKKSPLKISGKVAVGVDRDSRNFSGQPVIYRAHRAVIFAMAKLSCYTLSDNNVAG